MSFLSIAYNGTLIHETDESCTLNTEETYLDGDIEVIVNATEIPSAEGLSF